MVVEVLDRPVRVRGPNDVMTRFGNEPKLSSSDSGIPLDRIESHGSSGRGPTTKNLDREKRSIFAIIAGALVPGTTATPKLLAGATTSADPVIAFLSLT